MSSLYIFTDASFDPISKQGVIGFLICKDLRDKKSAADVQMELLSNTKNSSAEIEAAIFALKNLNSNQKLLPLTLLTDCKTICELPARKGKLELANYLSGRTGKELSQGGLYKEFFRLVEDLNITIRWVKGHSRAEGRSIEGTLFKVVDIAVRDRLRKILHEVDRQ